MSELEPTPPTAEPEVRLELALRSVYPDEATPTLSDFRKDPTRLISLEHLLATFGQHLPERQHGVLIRTLGLRGSLAETLEAVGRDLGVTRERVRAIGKQALGRLKKVALAKGLTLEITPERSDELAGYALERYYGTATDRADHWAFWGQTTLTKFVKFH